MKNLRNFGKDQFKLKKQKKRDTNISGKALNQKEVLSGKCSTILGEDEDQSEVR